MRVDVQTPKQRLVSLEQFLQRADQKALAEAARSGEELEIALLDHPADQGCLVDIVAALAPETAERLNARRQRAAFCLNFCIYYFMILT